MATSRLLWLPQVLRDAGLAVHEEPGWQTRGDETFTPRGVICHATASSRTSTVRGDINVLCYTGSSTAPAPISQLYLARSGEWWVLASGRCNHVRVGWAGPFEGLGNTYLVGVEAANDDVGEPWLPAQHDSYARGVAAILRHAGWPPPVGHKEHQPGAKVDPTFDMNQFRDHVAEILGGDMELTGESLRHLQNIAEWVAAQLRDDKDITGILGSAQATTAVSVPNHLRNYAQQAATRALPVTLDPDTVGRIAADILAGFAAALPGMLANLPKPPSAQEIATAVLDEQHRRDAE